MSKKTLVPLKDRGPLRVMFALTSMPVGGAEVLLQNLVQRFDRSRIIPEICCLKEKGELGEILSKEIPIHSNLLGGKYDLRIFWKLVRLFKKQKIDALVTVGAGDKMFWGRLAARFAGVPVITSALHSTGWPDGVGRLNRMLTPFTDAFIAVAKEHQRFLSEFEKFPAERVHCIPNGVDTERFIRLQDDAAVRKSLGLPESAPVVGIVAALRPEKNHDLFLNMAARVSNTVPEARFLIIGDGPERTRLEALAKELQITEQVVFAGTRQDIPEVLSTMSVFALTSHNEANPVSILEAMSIGIPVVSTDVGSIHESVADGKSGYLVPAGDLEALSSKVESLLLNPVQSKELGKTARNIVINSWSLDAMVKGYENLLTGIYEQKAGRGESLPDSKENSAELVESQG